MQLSRDAIQRMIGGRTNVLGTGGSGSEFDPSGFVTLAYLKSLTWWGQSLNDNDAVVGALTGVTNITMTGALTGATNVSAQKVTIGGFEIVYDETNQALKFNGSIYATGGVSALGYGPGGGGGGATALTDLVDVAISSPTNGQVLMYNSSTGKWYNGTVQSGGGGTVTSITAGTGLTGGTITSSGTIALSQETQTAIANGVTAYGWGDHSQAGYLTSSALTGYATQQWVQQQGYLTSSAISDMATKTWVGQQVYLTSSAISDMATKTWVNNQGFLTSSAISDMATKTWVNNQGFLTQHQTVSGTFWGQAWSNGGTVKGSLAAGSNGGVIEQFHCIELNNAGSLSGYGGYIDFHYNGSAADYTTRLIESEAGVLLIQGKNSTSPYGDKVVGLKVGSNVTGASYVQIGNVQLVYDSANNALKVQKGDGTAANFYATGSVSALGIGSGGGSVENLDIGDTLSFSSNGNVSEIYQDGDGQLWICGSENITMGNDVRLDGYSLYTNDGDVDCGSGRVHASRFYVGTGRYIYLDGTTLKYNDNGTVKIIVLS